jgi:hypothetical protein
MFARKLGRVAGLVLALAVVFGGVGVAAGSAAKARAPSGHHPLSTSGTDVPRPGRARAPTAALTEKGAYGRRPRVRQHSAQYAWLITGPLALFTALCFAFLLG